MRGYPFFKFFSYFGEKKNNSYGGLASFKNFTALLDTIQFTHDNSKWERTNDTQAGESGQKYPYYLQSIKKKLRARYNDLRTFQMDQKGHNTKVY